ncbi:MAG TPA: type II toxin-antitoxin system RelE/ParE family toxin [Acidisphaera sp.]|nr:type II toxin-antitoxin system RelE/ParE family toxin [Acidisphaera sp.]
MNKPAALAPAAQRDVASAFRWLAERNEAAALEFRELIRATRVLLGRYPLIGSVRLELGGERHRFFALRKFP